MLSMIPHSGAVVDGERAYEAKAIYGVDLVDDPQLSNVDHHGGESTAPVAVQTTLLAIIIFVCAGGSGQPR
ncbi:hypothetical protein Mycsm_06651 (plasmid) [Mycobacterium sp. JS623]|nr:hypothetical protein Mycsm_06651 [Mycobacterium sp. JS623]